MSSATTTVVRRPSQLRALGALTWYPLLAMTRNAATMGFGFLFPIVFIAIFGVIGSGGGAQIDLGVPAGASGPMYEALGKIPGVKVQNGDPADLERQLRGGKLDGLLLVEGDRVILTVNSANPQSQMVPLWLKSVIDEINLRAAGVTNPAVKLDVQTVAGREDRYIDFALPGQIGMALLSTGVFGVVFGLIFLKKSLVLKRMFATPVRALTILLGQGLARMVIGLLQAAVIILAGVILFDFHLANGLVTLASMLILSVLGLIVFLGFGLVIAGRSSSEEAASPLTNLFTLPQFLLSGTFFSTDAFPSWVQPIAGALPLTHFNTAMREIATEGASLFAVAPHIAWLLVWGIVAYVLAARTFKWT